DLDRMRVDELVDDGIEAAADAEAERGLDDRDDVCLILVLEQHPEWASNEQSDERADQADGQPHVAEVGRALECEGAVANYTTNSCALQESDEELDHLSSMTRKSHIGKADRSSPRILCHGRHHALELCRFCAKCIELCRCDGSPTHRLELGWIDKF